MNKQKETLRVRDFYKELTQSAAILEFSAKNGIDAVVPVIGESFKTIVSKFEQYEAQV